MPGPTPGPTTAPCSRCGTANPAIARFCMACGGAVAAPSADDRAATRIRFVTVTFCDLAGSTELAARLDPEVWHGVLADYFTLVRGAVERHGGRVEKFIGDAVVAVFGADGTAEDDAVRAVNASLDVVARLGDGTSRAELREIPLTVRFGVSSGRVVVTARDSSFAIGAVLNRAARLQSAAPRGVPLLDVRTWLLVRDQIACQEVEPVRAKGFGTPLQAWTADRGRPRTSADPPFVNQTALLDRVTDQIRARIDTPGVHRLALSGEIGIGKTALLGRLAHRLEALGLREIRVDCARDDEQQPRGRLLRLDRDLAATQSRPVPRTATSASALPKPRIEPSITEITWRIRRRLAALAAAGPVAVLIDNAQWAPPELLEVVAEPAEAAGPPGRLFFILAGRELPEAASFAPCAAVFPVPPLAAADARELLAALLPDGDVELHAADGHLSTIVRRGAGNPLFLEQLAALGREGLDDQVAPSAVAALGARIDRLGPDARRVLSSIGAWGRDVPVSDLSATCGFYDTCLADALAELDRYALGLTARGRAADGHLACATAAQVAYSHTGLRTRADLHTAIARVLRRRARTDAGAPGSAVVHAELALDCRRAIEPDSPRVDEAVRLAAESLVAEARHTIGRSEPARAARLAARAVELAETLDGAHGVADPARARPSDAAAPLILEAAAIETYALAASGRTTDALARIKRMRDTIPEAANPLAMLHLRINELALRGEAWDADEYERALIHRAADPGAEARLELMDALRQIRRGDYRGAQPRLEAAHRRVRALRGGLGSAEVYGNLSLVLAFGDAPIPEAARRCADLRAELADAPILHSVVGCSAALVEAMSGDRDSADRLLDEAEAVFRGTHHAAGLAGVSEFRSAVAELCDDPAAAVTAILAAAALYAQDDQDVPAQRCHLRAWLLDPDRQPEPADLPEIRAWSAQTLTTTRRDPDSQNMDSQDMDGWEYAMLRHQAAALAASRAAAPDEADSALRRALDVLAHVHGTGAVLTSLVGCRRIAQTIATPALLALIDATIRTCLATRAAPS